MPQMYDSIVLRMAKTENPYWRALADRLDRSVAAATPSLRKKTVVRSVPTFKSRRKQSRPKDAKRVYLVKFTLRRDCGVQFLKIGISAIAIRARFQCDERNYDVAILAESEWLSMRDAALTESALHAAFRSAKFRPPVLLASGNTECFAYSEDNRCRMANIISRGRAADQRVTLATSSTSVSTTDVSTNTRA